MKISPPGLGRHCNFHCPSYHTPELAVASGTAAIARFRVVTSCGHCCCHIFYQNELHVDLTSGYHQLLIQSLGKVDLMGRAYVICLFSSIKVDWQSRIFNFYSGKCLCSIGGRGLLKHRRKLSRIGTVDMLVLRRILEIQVKLLNRQLAMLVWSSGER